MAFVYLTEQYNSENELLAVDWYDNYLDSIPIRPVKGTTKIEIWEAYESFLGGYEKQQLVTTYNEN